MPSAHLSPCFLDTFLQGWQYFWRYTREDNAQARKYYLKAIELNLDFARTYANFEQFFPLKDPALRKHLIDGLIKAGLENTQRSLPAW